MLYPLVQSALGEVTFVSNKCPVIFTVRIPTFNPRVTVNSWLYVSRGSLTRQIQCGSGTGCWPRWQRWSLEGPCCPFWCPAPQPLFFSVRIATRCSACVNSWFSCAKTNILYVILAHLHHLFEQQVLSKDYTRATFLASGQLRYNFSLQGSKNFFFL